MARTFAQMLDLIRKSDEVLMGAVVEASGYVLHQYHANNRKVDGAGNNLAAQLITACPVWLAAPMKGWLQQGKRDPSIALEKCEDMASAKITGFFREQQVKRDTAKAKRAAAKISKEEAPAEVVQGATVPDATILEGEARVVDVTDALVVGGEVTTLSANEAAALMAYLASLRAPKLMVA